jgi:hypothetical protein
MNTKKLTRYTIHNTFHKSEVSFLAPHNPDGAYAAYVEFNYIDYSAHKDSDEYKAAHRKLLRIKRVLCGMSDCQCGGMIK